MRSLLIFVAITLAGCAQDRAQVSMPPPDAPHARLSEWGFLEADGQWLEIGAGAIPYELNTPLFTDYAGKLRTVWMADGTSAQMDEVGDIAFPVGTILSKTFYYRKTAGEDAGAWRLLPTSASVALGDGTTLNLDDNRLIETRLLVHYADGWQAYPYVWNEAQDEAWLEIAGDVRSIDLMQMDGDQPLTYIVPDANQCAGCHTPNHSDKALQPLGPQGWQLNRTLTYGSGQQNQLSHWRELGRLEAVSTAWPVAVDWTDTQGTSLELRARAYLDANCAHCHNPAGAADTSALHLQLEAPVDRFYGVCKTPVAVGRGSGDRPYDIYPGRPDDSILVYRMEHTDPAIAMPELGRSLVHAEGVALMREWISTLNGTC